MEINEKIKKFNKKFDDDKRLLSLESKIASLVLKNKENTNNLMILNIAASLNSVSIKKRVLNYLNNDKGE